MQQLVNSVKAVRNRKAFAEPAALEAHGFAQIVAIVIVPGVQGTELSGITVESVEYRKGMSVIGVQRRPYCSQFRVQRVTGPSPKVETAVR